MYAYYVEISKVKQEKETRRKKNALKGIRQATAYETS